MDDVYSALVTLCCIFSACLMIITTILSVYVLLKSISLYRILFNQKDKNKKE